MPIRPPLPGQEWQLRAAPLVIFDFRRPVYIVPSNNQPGGPGPRPKPYMKPLVLERQVYPVPRSAGTVQPVALKKRT